MKFKLYIYLYSLRILIGERNTTINRILSKLPMLYDVIFFLDKIKYKLKYIYEIRILNLHQFS